MTADCTLSILVARTDTSFMMYNIPHLVRMCNFPFKERVLVVDTAPLGRGYEKRPNIGTLNQLYNLCNELVSEGLIDKIVNINYQKDYRKKVYSKYFGKDMWQTHNYRGYPILGSIFAIEEAKTDYLLHFDSDMFLYQDPNYNWIEEGIKLSRKYSEILSLAPLSGPPTKSGILTKAQIDGEDYVRDDRGFYKFKTFSSRVFLVDCNRFEQAAPLPIPPLKKILPLSFYVKEILNFKRINTLPPWEEMVGARLENSQYIRVDIDSPKAWTLHPNERGQKYLEKLPELIQKIESGLYPPQQAGDYDLQFENWLSFKKYS
jgi:hypothetical protein